MVNFNETELKQLAIHKVGNNAAGEALHLSEGPLVLRDEVLDRLLMQYFLSPFEKVYELYHFTHQSDDVKLNELYHFVTMIFDDPENFHESGMQIARHLFSVSNHPKIKAGELYIASFKNIQLESELFDAVGIFKSEVKEPYLNVRQEVSGFQMSYEENAINVKKLDKGCLVFNRQKDEGYTVLIVDQTNRTEAAYWIDQFLQLQVSNNSYQHTNNTLGIYKKFVTEKMDEEFDLSKTDKIDLLNRSINYFKEKDHFNFDEFSTEVINNEKGIEMFKSFKSDFETQAQTVIDDDYNISNAAVKNQARGYKSVLKLDKNFHIYVHGNKDLIEKGFDEARKMSFYKVYFQQEV